MGGLVAIIIAADLFGAIRAEGWVGTSPNDPRANTGTMLVDGTLGVRVKADEVSFNAVYNPRVIETPPPEGSGLAAIHGVLASIDYQLSREGKIQLQELGSFGRNDFSLLVSKTNLSGALKFIDPRLPTKALLVIVDSDTTLRLDQQFTRRVRMSAMIGFLLYGGADKLAQLYIPLQRGPHGSAELSWLMAPKDRLSLTATGSQTRFADGSTTILAGLLAGWAHEFNDRTAAELSAGSGFDQTNGRYAGHSATPWPWVTAGIRHTIPVKTGGISGRAAVGLTPQIDRTSGNVYELASGALQLAWTVNRDLRFSAQANYGRALSGPTVVGSEVVTSEGSASFRIGDGASLGAGIRTAWQRVPPPLPGTLAQPGFQWATFANLTLSTSGKL
jgi:hypothetical protein